jgi:hypothetical protein
MYQGWSVPENVILWLFRVRPRVSNQGEHINKGWLYYKIKSTVNKVAKGPERERNTERFPRQAEELNRPSNGATSR